MLASERTFFDAQYGGAVDRVDTPETFEPVITPAWLPNGTPGGLIHRQAWEVLTEEGVAGKDLLDYACGAGHWAIRLAQEDARATGFDLSSVAIERARRRAYASGVNVRFDIANAGQLPYPSDSYDIIIGIGALHHTIKYANTADELARVLRARGLAVFCENLGGNPLIQLARRVTMMKDAGDTILTTDLINEWAGDRFARVEIRPESLFFMAKRLTHNRRLLRALHFGDRALFKLSPSLRRLCGECLIVIRR